MNFHHQAKITWDHVKKATEEGSLFLPLRKLKEFSPFSNTVWPKLKKPISKQEIAEALQNGNFQRKPVKETAPREQHIARIAFLVKNGWSDPIVVNLDSFWPILDGNHRLAAAIYRKDRKILVSPDGFLSPFEDYFDVEIP